MSAEYSIITPQTVQPNQPAVFLDSPCPCVVLSGHLLIDENFKISSNST